MSSGGFPYQLPTKKRPRLVVAPVTRLVRWAVGLAVASVVTLIGWTLLGPLGGAPGLHSGSPAASWR